MNMVKFKPNIANPGKLKLMINIIYLDWMTLFLIEHNYCVLILFKIIEHKSVQKVELCFLSFLRT